MSASIIDGEVIRASDGCVNGTVHGVNNYACNALGVWMLQRMAHQRGCWYVSLYLRGLVVTGLAVQDDYGDLQMVSV